MGGGGWRYPTPSRPAPVPTQQRAQATVRAAIEATVDLLERAPEREVTLEAIRRRSGVSQGSLTHHFGGREGLIAAAHVERYGQSCRADEQFLHQLDGVLTDSDRLITTLLGMLDQMLSPERQHGRWLRLSAIAAAFGDRDLTTTLSRRYTGLTDRLTHVVAQAHASGLLRPDVDARTTALMLTMQAQGLVLDDISGLPVERSAWNHMQARFATTFLTEEVEEQLLAESSRRYGDLWRAEVFRGACEAPADVAHRLGALRDRAGHPRDQQEDFASLRALMETALQSGLTSPGRTTHSPSEVREQFLTHAIAALRAHGARGVDVARIRSTTGLSPQSFHRMFGTRDDLILEARIRLEVNRAARAVARFIGILTSARTAADVRAALARGAVEISSEDALTAMWQRIETIDASRTDTELRTALSRLQRVARDLVVEHVCLAQRRDLIDATLPPTGIARLLDGSMFWHVFHGLDARRPSQETWTGMLARIVWLISPDR